MLVVAAALSAAATVGVVAWRSRDDGPSTTAISSPAPQPTTATDPAITEQTAPVEEVTPEPTEPSQAPTPDPTPIDPGTVVVADALSGSAEAQDVAATMSEFYTAINERRLRDAYALYSSAQRRKLGAYSSWAAGYSSTSDDEVTLVDLSSAGSGRVVAHVRFRSQQDPADSPDGMSSCLWWQIAYTLVPSGGGYLIDEVHPDVPAPQKAYSSC